MPALQMLAARRAGLDRLDMHSLGVGGPAFASAQQHQGVGCACVWGVGLRTSPPGACCHGRPMRRGRRYRRCDISAMRYRRYRISTARASDCSFLKISHALHISQGHPHLCFSPAGSVQTARLRGRKTTVRPVPAG
jgi:hypothetical protein